MMWAHRKLVFLVVVFAMVTFAAASIFQHMVMLQKPYECHHWTPGELGTREEMHAKHGNTTFNDGTQWMRDQISVCLNHGANFFQDSAVILELCTCSCCRPAPLLDVRDAFLHL